MDLGTIISVAQTLFAALHSQELRDICSILGYKSQLEDLKETVKTVKAVLLDAEARDDEEFTHQAQLFIEQLKEVVYEADDLLDEFVTIAERKHKKLLKDGVTPIVPNKLLRFFSSIKAFPFSYKMSQKVKEIRKKLDDIADNHNKFGFKIDSQPIRKRREGTCSYVYTQDIIGRDGDKEKIVGMLLDPNVRQNVSFLTIVGIGGLGKTTLAQLIYNDEKIQKEFTMKLWVCVGDDDPNHLNVNMVLGKILESSSGHKSDKSTPDFLRNQVRKCLSGKYLLVLDDIWNENRHDWLKLEAFLKGGSPGSWVLATTRSRETAKIIGDGFSYELEGLSNEESWRLFERVAFGQEEEQTNPSDLVKVGQVIVKKCANVPLAIRVAGSLLYGQAKDKWLSFERNGLTEVSPKKNDILSILKFSYHHLDSPLKSCFSYCALFPKDHVIDKEMLISLWMAQGFIVPLEKGQSIEDAGEEYFLILLHRCFFQDVKKDEYDEIISFKLHDLMHDVAQEMTKNEVRAIDCITNDLDEKIRHLSVDRQIEVEASFTMSKVRTLLYLCIFKKGLSVGTLADNWTSLRALDLSSSKIVSLPDQMSKLLHLRYLDLSWNKEMKVLPKSFTKLHNLETLLLKECRSLIELPNDFGKLVKLRRLDIEGCAMITHMPTGMGKLSYLHKLTTYAVNLSNSSHGDVLKGLQILKKIKGKLEIRVKGCENAIYEKGNNSEEGYLWNKQHLSWINFKFEGDEGEENEEALMEDMQPHANLRRLSIEGYKGKKLPSWAREDNLTASLQMLQQIDVCQSDGLEYLASLGKLHHLGTVKIISLRNLEYIEENREESGTEAGAKEGSLCFPSVKVLELKILPRLKGWWRIDDDEEEEEEEDMSSRSRNRRRRRHQVSPLFPHLSTLAVRGCPELSLIFRVPNVEEVELRGINENLRLRGRQKWGGAEGPTCSQSQNSSKLRKVMTDDVRCLKLVLPIEALQCLPHLRIIFDHKVERLDQVWELWRSYCSSSLRILYIGFCDNLKSVGKVGLQHLTALEELCIEHCPNLTLTQEAERDNIISDESSCPPLPQSLQSLRLNTLPKVVNLPEGMQHLTSLHSLSIYNCKALNSLPQWMPHLTSLTHLDILSCSEELKQRCCGSPPGQDWPYIQHIPRFHISTNW